MYTNPPHYNRIKTLFPLFPIPSSICSPNNTSPSFLSPKHPETPNASTHETCNTASRTKPVTEKLGT